MNSLSSSGTGILIVILLVVAVFLVSREILTWYWKQTEIVTLLKQIEKNTRTSSDSSLNVAESGLSQATASKSLSEPRQDKPFTLWELLLVVAVSIGIGGFASLFVPNGVIPGLVLLLIGLAIGLATSVQRRKTQSKKSSPTE